MDIGQHAALPSPQSLPRFQRLFPDDAACAGYLEKARWAGGSSVRIVVWLANRSALRPARACWHAAHADVRQD
jgi:hypothetical protein